MATWSKGASIHPLACPSSTTRGSGMANVSPGRGQPMPPSMQAAYGEVSSLRRAASTPTLPAVERYATALRRGVRHDVLFYELFGAWDAYPENGRDDLAGAVSPASLAAAAAMTSSIEELRSVIALEAPKIMYDASRAMTAQLRTASRRNRMAAMHVRRQESRRRSGEVPQPPLSRRALKAEIGARLEAEQQEEERAKLAKMDDMLYELNLKADENIRLWTENRAEARKRERANARAAARKAGFWGLPVEDNRGTAEKDDRDRQKRWAEAKAMERVVRQQEQDAVAERADRVRAELEASDERKRKHDEDRRARAKLEASRVRAELDESRVKREAARAAREELCEDIREAERQAKANAVAGVLSPAARAHAHATRAAHVGVDLRDVGSAAEQQAVRAAKARAVALEANARARKSSHDFFKAQPKKIG